METSKITTERLGRTIGRLAGVMAFLVPALALAIFWSVDFLDDRARVGPEVAPIEWAEAATEEDQLETAALDIAYWGKPDAQYSNYATKGKKKPEGIVVHFTRVKPVLWMVKYGHVRDRSRGGASFGYHFYIGRDGKVVQGAPLSKRTNHIKTIKRKERTQIARNLWSGNTIGISMVGACDRLLRPNAWWQVTNCSGEYLTPKQLDSGLKLIKILQEKYDMACREVFGHGELQTDRDPFEGASLTRRARNACPDETQEVVSEEKADKG